MNLQDTLAAARKAIEDGDMETAAKLTEEAKALKAINDLTPPESPKQEKTPEPPAPAAPIKAVVESSPGFVVEDEADRALKAAPFKSFGEFLFAVKDYGRGQFDQRLQPLKSSDAMDAGGFNLARAMGEGFVGSVTNTAAFFSGYSSAPNHNGLKAAPSGLGESLPAAGGYLVTSDRNTSILTRMYETGQLLQRMIMVGIGPNANGMTFYADAESSRVNGSRHGGVRAYWMAENSAITASAPKFRLMDIKLNKAAALVYATDELLADAAALESYVMKILPDELRFICEDALVNGTGAGQPLGVLNSGAVVSVAKEVGQGADTVVAENVIKMWSRLWARSRPNAVWVVNQDVEPQLLQMNVGVGTGGALVYMPPGGLSGSPYGTLFSRPVIAHESAATVGDAGDIMLLDMTQYQAIEKGGMQTASSIHVRFTQDEQVFRFIYRVGGQPTWDLPLTPFKGTNTQSPFVTLDARA